jgi:hypothetical protein
VRLVVIRLNIQIFVIGKGGTKKGMWEKRWVGGGRIMGSAGFCGPSVCFIVVLFL